MARRRNGRARWCDPISGADALIASAYLSGTNTRRVRRALAALFGGSVGKDTVSRVWRKVKSDWDAWNARSFAEEPIIRLILDGTVVRVRLDKKSTLISLLIALGVRQDGQKVLLAVKNMGGESEAAWRALLDDLVNRGLKTPELVIVDGAPGLERALAALWPDVWSNAARFINIAIFLPMRRSDYTRKYRRTTRI
jgi:putative transposase